MIITALKIFQLLFFEISILDVHAHTTMSIDLYYSEIGNMNNAMGHRFPQPSFHYKCKVYFVKLINYLTSSIVDMIDITLASIKIGMLAELSFSDPVSFS